MAQTPDFVAKLVDDVALARSPAISFQVLKRNDVLKTDLIDASSCLAATIQQSL